MDCPNCGRPLSWLQEVLAVTESGTQCRNCWTVLRRLAGVTTFKPVRRPRSLQDHRQRRAA